MKLFSLFKQKIIFFKKEIIIGIKSIIIKFLFYFSVLMGVFYFIQDVKYVIKYIIAYVLLQFDKLLDAIPFYIIPNKNIIFFSILGLLLFIGLPYLSYKFVRLIKYFRYYIEIITASAQKIKIFILSNANKQIFKNIQTYLGKILSNLAYNILTYIWDRVKYFSIFGNYKILRKHIIENVKIIKKYFSPLINFFTFFTDKIFFLFTKNDLTEDDENSFLLMDEGKQLTKIKDIPDKIISLLSNDMIPKEQVSDNKFIAQPIILHEWEQTINETIQRWESGNISSLIITGTMGSGKTTLLNHIKLTNQKYNTKYFKLNRKNNILKNEFFVNLINTPFNQFDTIEKQIILFDDIEHLFLSKVGGFDIIKQFFILVERTKEKILWVITANSSFFSFLNKIFPIVSIFQKQLILDNFNTKFLLSIYENKLRSIGYEFFILKNKKIQKEIKKNIKHKVIATNEINHFLKQNYFEQSFNLGKNNFYFYNFYFLRSIKYIKNQTLFLDSCDFLEIPNLEERTTEELFILRAILVHKSLDKEELERILLFTPAFVSITLSLFYENNLIQKHGENFMIYPPVYSQVVNFFRNKNLID